MTELYSSPLNNATGKDPFAGAPDALKEQRQWVVWKFQIRDGKLTKVPYSAITKGLASSTDPATWATYAQAAEAFSAGGFDGIGYVFSADDGLTGIDLDKSLNEDGTLKPWAQELYAPFAGTYTEVSPSGTGIKLWTRAILPGKGRKINGQGPDRTGKIEIYDRDRYFTVTSRIFQGAPSVIADRQEAVTALYAKFPQKGKAPPAPRPGCGLDADDSTLIDKAKSAANGAKFARLWSGDTSDHGGDDSSADLALCNMLAFWTGPDHARIDRLFRQSGLYREKWERQDYRERTISAALAGRTEFYDPQRRREEKNDVADKSPQAGEKLRLADFPLTDAGNGEQIFHRHGLGLRFVALWKKPIVFNDTHWEIDETGWADRLALETMRAMKRKGARMAESEDDAEHARGIKLQKFAHACESHRKLKDMLARAATIEGASIMPAMLDADPWLLNVKNGTLDLRTGELRPHHREDFITKLAPVVYDPALCCPAFLTFLDRIFSSNERLIGFIQRSIGYTLTGITSERAFFILFGAGRNGKSTLLGIIREALGDYATQTAADTLMVKRHEGISNDIARLKGARFVSATESDEGRCLAEGLVKRMTGGEDVLTARFMRAEFFDFKPEFKLWLGTNHRPVIRGNDPAIWDRIRLIPFDVRIPDEEVDRELPAKLRAELGGILAWAVRGCLEWQQDGLDAPEEVRAAVETYRDDMDRMGDFIADCCVTGERCEAAASALYELYKTWCALNGEEAINQTRFGRQLSDRGYGTTRKRNPDRKIRTGIGIRASKEESGDSSAHYAASLSGENDL